LKEIKTQKDFYPNIYSLLQLFATLPATTASAEEKTFTCLRHLKRYLRNNIGEEKILA